MSTTLADSLFTEEEIYLAYRKAKADMFFERSLPTARKFACYEDELQANLKKLLQRLSEAGDNPWWNDRSFIGNVTFVPKKLAFPNDPKDDPCFFSSNATDNWNRLFVECEKVDGGLLKAEFRPIADFTVDMHIVCALWINLVGEQIDSCIDSTALGARLRRVNDENSLGEKTRRYHRMVWQSFEPYFRSYKQWRDGGFAVIRSEIGAGRKVAAITLDFRRFFHNIDPRFLLDERFISVICERSCIPQNGSSPPQLEFTTLLVQAFETWGKSVPGYREGSPIGVPVGATASRIIANALLTELDEAIVERLNPLYYARYVDDIFLVLKDNGHFRSGGGVLDWIVDQMDNMFTKNVENEQKEILSVQLSYKRNSRIEFQTDKQRVFLIDNTDLLDAIQGKIEEISSEWRLLPDLRALERSPAAKVLSTSKSGDSDGDALRKADTLSLRRLGFALMLRNVDAIVRDLPAKHWKKEREDFYEFALRHVVAPGKLFELSDYLPRLVSIAVSCRDWKYARKIVATVVGIFVRLQKCGDTVYLEKTQESIVADKIWTGFFDHLRAVFYDALLKSLPKLNGKKIPKQCLMLRKAVWEISPEFMDLIPEPIGELAEKLFVRDLSRMPFKAHLLDERGADLSHATEMAELMPNVLYEKSEEIVKLFEVIKRSDLPIAPMLFPTRPLGPEDLSILCPNIGSDIEKVKQFLNAVRGTHYRFDSSSEKKPIALISIGYGKSKFAPRIAVTSFLTEHSSWCAAASEKPDHSKERFSRLVEMCNGIIRTQSDARPHYVVFPELSIPRKWTRTIAEGLLRSRISLITGEEYSRHRNDKGVKSTKYVDSSARLYLTDNRLGYPSWCALTQLKAKPAPGERDELRQKFGLTLKPSNLELATKFIYNHFGLHFGILICSELTDMKNRLRFRGRVDSLFVLSWNRDLESFAALVDSAALDIHCFVALVNNRQYGDSRVRIPHKDSWMRDAVRVKGGLADYFVVSEIDVESLRDFQSQAESPPAPFKPVPEGFVISKNRRIVPGVRRNSTNQVRSD